MNILEVSVMGVNIQIYKRYIIFLGNYIPWPNAATGAWPNEGGCLSLVTKPGIHVYAKLFSLINPLSTKDIYKYILCGVLQQPRTYIYVLRQMKSPKVWSLRKELWSLRKVAGCWVYLALVGKGLKINSLPWYGSSSETQGRSVGPGEMVQWKFSSTGGKAPGYPLSLDHFQTVANVGSWFGTKILCIIVANQQTASPGSPRMDMVYNTYNTIQYNSLLTLPWWGFSVTMRLKKKKKTH